MKTNLEDIKKCRWCQTEFSVHFEKSADFIITGGTCTSCAKRVFKSNDMNIIRKYIDTIDNPILLLQPEPRQVYTANKKACELFGKELPQIEGYRGGQVFDCIQSFTEAGCGKDKNCEDCSIKGAIIETFTTGNSFENIKRPLDVYKDDKTLAYFLQIATEKIGDFALVRIDNYSVASNEY